MAAAPYTLAQLLSAQSADQVRAKFLAILGADPNPTNVTGNVNHGFPVPDWLSNPAGMEMAFVNMERQALYDLVTSVMPAQIASGWLAKAKADWLTFHAQMFYQVSRNPATFTVFNLQLSSTASAPPYDFNPGDVWVIGASNHRYVSTSGGHLGPGGTLVLAFQAELAGSAANDNPTVSAPSLVTAFAGVTVSASVGDFTAVYHQGIGTGSITVTRLLPLPFPGGPTPGTYYIRIDVGGDPGTARFSLSTDGVKYVVQGPLRAAPGSANVYLFIVIATAGAGTPNSFIAGDIYTVTTPGGTGYVQGNDIESDASLIQRCRARWPSISLNQVADEYVLWTKLAVPSINRATVQADPFAGGRVQIVAADSHGGVDATAVNAIAAYIQPRVGDILSPFPSIAPAVNSNMVTGATVTVTAQTSSAVQSAVAAAWPIYLGTVPIGGVVELSKLAQIIMDAGAVDFTGLTINGVATNIELGSNQVPVAVSILTEMTWINS